MKSEEGKTKPGKDFIREIIDEDLAAGKNGRKVATRLPPEPKAIPILATPNLYVSTMAWRPNMAGPATCAWTTRIRKARVWNMWMPLFAMWNGWGLMVISVSSSPLIITNGYITVLWNSSTGVGPMSVISVLRK